VICSTFGGNLVSPFSARENSIVEWSTMTTPVETYVGKKTLDSIKHGAMYVFKLGRRIATLEARVTELEAKLAKRLPDGCPKCGEMAMRVTSNWGINGSPPNQWRQDEWKCEKCEYHEPRIVRFKA
jgi:hypothetical protein